MEVISPSDLTLPFKFDTPSCLSASSSPHRIGATFFYSAPSSPIRAFGRHDFHHGDDNCSPSSAVPFYWEEKPGTPKEDNFKDADFEFDSSRDFGRCSVSADELFDGGKIRPLKPPPGFQYSQSKPLGSPKSPPSSTKLIFGAFSPRHRVKDFDPFAAALEETRRSNFQESVNGDKGTKSLSPFRVSHLLSNQETTKNHHPAKASLSPASSFSSLWHKKWRIKDFLLFRSASESWKTDDNQMKKDSFLNKTHDQDESTESSFSSNASVESESSRRRSVPPISAHKFHYSVKRTVSEEMRKRRSLLPHRQGILGCLGFHRSVPQSL
ncbi:hypothetical protein F511_10291 [Dorcoceras hygrometricum]|uniref:Uncharacterized protein n=1 Tax=Dorcoceras hygrometricum TaxID=472368 RepID=A0A2Z7C361_9LAMI|nr:hypothetical protein F511_10291 [Dorcoceras hygrometricum]